MNENYILRLCLVVFPALYKAWTPVPLLQMVFLKLLFPFLVRLIIFFYYSELLIKAMLTTLYKSRLQNIAVAMYKVKNNILVSLVVELVTSPTVSYRIVS